MALNLFEDNNEMIYTAIYNYQDKTVSQASAYRSVMSKSDMSYEWYRSLYGFEVVENDKYYGIVITTERKKYLSEDESNYDTIHTSTKYYIKKSTVQFIESLNDYRHGMNILKKHLKIAA